MKNIEVNIEKKYYFDGIRDDVFESKKAYVQYAEELLNYISVNIIDFEENSETTIKVYDIKPYSAEMDLLSKDYIFKHISGEGKYIKDMFRKLNSGTVDINKSLFKDRILFIDGFDGVRSFEFYLNVMDKIITKTLKDNITIILNSKSFSAFQIDEEIPKKHNFVKIENFFVKYL